MLRDYKKALTSNNLLKLKEKDDQEILDEDIPANSSTDLLHFQRSNSSFSKNKVVPKGSFMIEQPTATEEEINSDYYIYHKDLSPYMKSPKQRREFPAYSLHKKIQNIENDFNQFRRVKCTIIGTKIDMKKILSEVPENYKVKKFIQQKNVNILSLIIDEVDKYLFIFDYGVSISWG